MPEIKKFFRVMGYASTEKEAIEMVLKGREMILNLLLKYGREATIRAIETASVDGGNC